MTFNNRHIKACTN